MKHADARQLQTVISQVIGGSTLAKKFKHLTLDAGDGNDEREFIRVLVHLSDLEEISDDDVDTLISSIENEVIRYDDRFPSVRFSVN